MMRFKACQCFSVSNGSGRGTAFNQNTGDSTSPNQYPTSHSALAATRQPNPSVVGVSPTLQGRPNRETHTGPYGDT